MRYLQRFDTSVLIVLASFVCLIATNSPAAASTAAHQLLRIPVFFITDRNLQPTSSGAIDFGPHRKYIGDCQHDPYMGSAYCVVENVDGKQLSDQLKSLGWATAPAGDKLGDFQATTISGDSFEKIQKDFYGRVHSKAILTTDKNLFVFAHGFKNSFHAALHTAAKLAYNAERPLILYSWPSVAKVFSYTSDENNVEWSQEHFNDMTAQLEAMCLDDPAVKVRIFAHSMGTRLVVRATPLLREKKYVIEAALICPDIDDGLVKHYARRYLSVDGTAQIRLYMSRRDKALALSQVVHGGYTRLGEQADALGGLVSRALSWPNTKSQVQKEEDIEFADRLKQTRKRMQTIDFTSIDRGLLGHNVPAKLVCSMSFTGTPGPGLELVSEASGQRSKISNLFTRMAKLNVGGDATLTEPGTVLRVVVDNARKHTSVSEVADQRAGKISAP